MVTCPKCGYLQESAEECAGCGVIIRKALARVKEEVKEKSEAPAQEVSTESRSLTAESGASPPGLPYWARSSLGSLNSLLRLCGIGSGKDAAEEKSSWQFLCREGEVFFESNDIGLIKAKLLDGSLPADSLCRRATEGLSMPVSESLAREEPRIGLLYNPAHAAGKIGARFASIIGAAVAALVVLVGIAASSLDTLNDFYGSDVFSLYKSLEMSLKLVFAAVVVAVFLLFIFLSKTKILGYAFGVFVMMFWSAVGYSFLMSGGSPYDVLLFPIVVAPVAGVMLVTSVIGSALAGSLAGAGIGKVGGLAVGYVARPYLKKLPAGTAGALRSRCDGE